MAYVRHINQVVVDSGSVINLANSTHPFVMGQAIAKPDWSPRPHHQIVVEPSSKPRNNGFGHFFDASRRGERRNDKELPRTPKQRGFQLFNRSPSGPRQWRQPKQPRQPIAQVIVHRPATTHRTRDYLARLTDPSFSHDSDQSHIALSTPISKHPPTTGGRFFHPPRTLALMDVGSRLAERRKEARREWRECLKAERARRFDDACREYAALKVVTEQDIINRAKKERKREARRQREYTV